MGEFTEEVPIVQGKCAPTPSLLLHTFTRVSSSSHSCPFCLFPNYETLPLYCSPLSFSSSFPRSTPPGPGEEPQGWLKDKLLHMLQNLRGVSCSLWVVLPLRGLGTTGGPSAETPAAFRCPRAWLCGWEQSWCTDMSLVVGKIEPQTYPPHLKSL